MDFSKLRQTMVDTQIRVNDVTDFEVVDAFLYVPREIFVPKTARGIAYSEIEIQTSQGRALWTPRDFAKLLKAAEPKSSDVALLIGAGSGYEAGVVSRVVDTAIALEDSAELVEKMTDRFSEAGLDSAVSVQGELRAGLPDQAPFDLIIICGMIETMPDAWGEQLSDGGRLAVVAQVDRDLGKGRIYTKAGNLLSYRDVFDCRPPKFSEFDKKEEFEF